MIHDNISLEQVGRTYANFELTTCLQQSSFIKWWIQVE